MAGSVTVYVPAMSGSKIHFPLITQIKYTQISLIFYIIYVIREICAFNLRDPPSLWLRRTRLRETFSRRIHFATRTSRSPPD